MKEVTINEAGNQIVEPEDYSMTKKTKQHPNTGVAPPNKGKKMKCGRCRQWKKNCKCGRPLVFTEDVKKKLEQAFAIGCTVSEACLYADISNALFYLHAPKGSILFDEFQRLRDNPILKARSTVVAALGDAETAKWYLKNKRNQEFNERVVRDGEPDHVTVNVELQRKVKKALEDL